MIFKHRKDIKYLHSFHIFMGESVRKHSNVICVFFIYISFCISNIFTIFVV